MEKIYLLSAVVAVIAMLPIVCILLGSGIDPKEYPSVILTQINKQSFSEDDILRLKALWWDEHFCGCENGRDVVAVATGFDENEYIELERMLSPVRLVKQNELINMLGKGKT